jgi:hypothetical protein
MNKHSNYWVLCLSLIIGLASTACAGQPKDKLDLEAEAKQIEAEEAQQKADHDKGIKGRHQRAFFGTFVAQSEMNENISPDVVGIFVTNQTDKKPGRRYLVKAENNSKNIVDTLKRFNQKNAQVTGRLRVIDENGEAKYLVVSTVVEISATPPAVERTKLGGF